MHSRVILIALTGSVAVACSTGSTAIDDVGAVEILLTHSGVQPAIDGDLIVWFDPLITSFSIVTHDVVTGTQNILSSGLQFGDPPAVSGRRVAWTDRLEDGFVGPVLYEMGTGFLDVPRPPGPGDDVIPTIDGDRLVWERRDSTRFTLFLYDLRLETRRQLTDDSFVPSGADIDGRHVVWTDFAASDPDVVLLDLETETTVRLGVPGFGQRTPRVSDGRVVWTDLRNGDADIYLYDTRTGTERRLTDNPAEQIGPDISGSLIVWTDDRFGHSDIFLHDLETGSTRRLTTNSANQRSAAVSDGRVVWQDGRDGVFSLYYATVPR